MLSDPDKKARYDQFGFAGDQMGGGGGFDFGGWYKDAACTNGNEFRFGYELEANTTIYAKWTEVTSGNYTVIIWRAGRHRLPAVLSGVRV